MKKPLNPRLGQMILRIVLGVIFVAHGAATLFGDGGPGGLAGFLGSLGVPVPILAAWLVTLLEFVGGMFLIVGLFVLPTAILLAVHMLLGIILVHAQNGFYVVGPGTNGVEFNLLLIAGLLSLLLGGPGLAAVDSRSAPQAAAPPPPQPEPVPAPGPTPEPEPEPEPEAATEPEPEGRQQHETGGEAEAAPEPEPEVASAPEPSEPGTSETQGSGPETEDERP
ncbi:MAG: DoxX family protein, partial [Gemmatimonadota bacterium]